MRMFLMASMVLTSMTLCSGCGSIDQKADADEIQIARTWLNHLKSEKTDLEEALSVMSSEVNFDGKIVSEEDQIRKKLAEYRQALTNTAWTVRITDFERLDDKRIEQLMRNSKHTRSYALSRDKIRCMVLFRLRVVLKSTGEENTDGVFLGFDADKKIVSWFD